MLQVEKIKYLQNLINELSKPDKDSVDNNKLSHRQIAIAHDFMDKALNRNKISRIEAQKMGGKRREQAFDTIQYWGQSKNKTVRNIDSKDLKAAMILLKKENDNAFKAASNLLDKIENS